MKYVWDIIFWYFHIQNWRLNHYSLLMNYFQIWKMELFSLHVQVFFTFLPHRTYSFSGPCFCCSLSSWFPLSPSLCRSDRGDGGCCQPSVNNTGDFLDVYQLPLSFICLSYSSLASVQYIYVMLTVLATRNHSLL